MRAAPASHAPRSWQTKPISPPRLQAHASVPTPHLRTVLTLCFDRTDRALAEELARQCRECETAHRLHEARDSVLPQTTTRVLILLSVAALESDWLDPTLDQVRERELPCLVYRVETTPEWPARVAVHPSIEDVDALRECLQSFEFYTED